MDGVDYDKPLLQVVKMVRLDRSAPYRQDEYRLYLSDGKYYATNVKLHQKLNNYAEDNTIRKNTVICITKYELSILFLQS